MAQVERRIASKLLGNGSESTQIGDLYIYIYTYMLYDHLLKNLEFIESFNVTYITYTLSQNIHYFT